MKIIELTKENSLIGNFLAEIRDTSIQKDSMRFRRNLERMGEIIAYEISKTLNYRTKDVSTPLGIASCNVISDQIVLATLLRAGLPLHNGILNYFDHAQNCFISSYRKVGNDNKFTIHLEYMTSPSVDDKVVILSDAVLATGSSFVLACKKLLESEELKHIHIVTLIASRAGVENLSASLPHKKVTLWVGAIDEEMTNKSLIIPGLGDAGNLAYGDKR